ncbi:hypothetical protein BJ165DRAFT_1402825 [Panaeolus papilionaceus]|nr:hypothetical protein BJ165DRAFT_1402825 [Panaeolus papilionaceus]
MSNPIAWIQLPELDGSNLKTPALVVPSASESMWDVIVAGWVILEQKVRLDEKVTHKATGMTSQEAALTMSMHMSSTYTSGGGTQKLIFLYIAQCNLPVAAAVVIVVSNQNGYRVSIAHKKNIMEV